jgi:hypothetical protein
MEDSSMMLRMRIVRALIALETVLYVLASIAGIGVLAVMVVEPGRTGALIVLSVALPLFYIGGLFIGRKWTPMFRTLQREMVPIEEGWRGEA